MWTLANGLTLSRFVTAPVFFLLLHALRGPETARLSWIALVVLVVTLLTDMFDGMAARNLKEVTDFGKIMDPVADSTFFLTALAGLVTCARFEAPVWALLVVLYREIAMHVLRRYAALRGIVMAAKISGKAKMCGQSVVLVGFVLVVALADSGLLDAGEAALRRGAWWACAFFAAVNLLSLPEYLAEIPRLRRANGGRNAGEDAAQ